MLKTGTLSYKEFENELLDFTEIAKSIQDSWNLEFSKVRSLIQCYMPKCVKEGCRCERFLQGRG